MPYVLYLEDILKTVHKVGTAVPYLLYLADILKTVHKVGTAVGVPFVPGRHIKNCS